MNDYYVLDGHEVVAAQDIVSWSRWFEKAGRTVAKTKLGDAEVSTVFLAMNHAFSPRSKPVLFETLVFGGPLDQEMDRYHTWDEAEAGHAEMVARVTAAFEAGAMR